MGGIVMIASFFSPQGAPNSGWTSCPPLADFATMLLLAFPPLLGAAILQAADRLVGTSFFLPSGLIVSGEIV
jgi:heme/copper-type cytochrome/quinol oxidase subunit 1